MQEKSTAQQIALVGMQQGHLMTVLITGAGQSATLEFQHQDDATWRAHPDHTTVAEAGGVILMKDIRCLGTKHRINFAAPPAEYRISVIWEAVPTF